MSEDRPTVIVSGPSFGATGLFLSSFRSVDVHFETTEVDPAGEIAGCQELRSLIAVLLIIYCTAYLLYGILNMTL